MYNIFYKVLRRIHRRNEDVISIETFLYVFSLNFNFNSARSIRSMTNSSANIFYPLTHLIYSNSDVTCDWVEPVGKIRIYTKYLKSTENRKIRILLLYIYREYCNI